MTKAKKIVIGTVEIELEPFVDANFLQAIINELYCVNEENISNLKHAHLRNLQIIAVNFGFPCVSKSSTLQLDYFRGISETDKLFNYRDHEDYKRLRQVLLHGLSSRKCPDVIVNLFYNYI